MKSEGDLSDCSHNKLIIEIILYKLTLNKNLLLFFSSSNISKSFFVSNFDLTLSNLLITG